MKKKLMIVGAIIIAVLAVVILRNLSVLRARGDESKQTFTLKKADLTDSVLASGTVKSSNTKNVYSKVTGYPVKEVYFKVGDKVKAGDVLAQLDTTSLELDIRQTELNLKNAKRR
jgi:multidrug efflux pump subunit AcrA (membrane-fusion protein)